MRAPRLLIRSSNKAAALIIVLAFVVLLAGLALAYFSRITTDRQMAQSSLNDTTADLLARSALDTVVADFQQEIANGSINPVPVVTPAQTSGPFIPSVAANVVPQRNVSGIPNLIRISLRGDPIALPAVGSRASDVSSTTDPSANGRSISTTRWNKHCLITPATGATISNPVPTPPNPNPTPVHGQTPASFDPPDWVIVTRAGPTPFASWNATLADPTNTNYAIGRYAYAVYDEGGLLDINVAGFPKFATPIPLSLTGRKGVAALADLTVLASPSPSPTPYTNTIVYFRNYATEKKSNVSNLSFIPLGFYNDFVDYFLGNQLISGSVVIGDRVGTSRDFGTVRNDVTAQDGRTDQSFITRAELINYFNTIFPSNATIGVNLLQCLGTFSREQNKPTLPLTPAWPFTRVVLPKRFHLGDLNLVVYLTPTPSPTATATPTATPSPTATPTLTASIQSAFGLQFVSASSPTPTPPPPTPTATPTPSPCIGQVRWEYVGNQNVSGTPTPLPAIPALPSDLTTLDFFQYLNYALFGVTGADSTNIPYTLGIGAALIDQYDQDGAGTGNSKPLITGIYYGSHTPTCDPTISANIVYGAEQGTNGASARSAPPTGISPPPSPDPLCSGCPYGVPPVNEGFRNVGEFGWAYSIFNAANSRNNSTTPKYLIDFKDAYDPNNNPDPALLDFFTFNSAPVRSGIVSLNTRQAPVLAALFSLATYGGSSFAFGPSQAMLAGNLIVNDPTYGTIAHPAMSRADIARFGGSVANTVLGVTASQDGRDSFARVLSELTQTRTWGLLIDVVAQTGHYKPNAQGLADFVVEGEKRYWLHVAIDRFDGTIVGQRLEEVTD